MSAVNTTITTVMRGVAEALKFDGDNKIQDAYMKYLECILRICTKLLQDARFGANVNHVVGTDTVKMVRLGQQCMERVSVIVSQFGDKTTSSFDSHSQSQMLCTPSGTKSEPCTPSEHFQSSKLFTDSLNFPSEQSPLELAYKQNEQLKMAYKARLARMDPKRRMATSLTVQRKMAENLAIAKVQEEALEKKMKERQQRLEEQAVRRFGTPAGLTEDDKEQRQIYKKVLEYEQEHTVFENLRKRLEEKPYDPDLINKLIEEITRSPDHPLNQKMYKQKSKISDKLQHLVKEKMSILEQVKVPLSETLYPTHHWDQVHTCNDGEMEGTSSVSETESEIKKDGDSGAKEIGMENYSFKEVDRDNLEKEKNESSQEENGDKWEPCQDLSETFDRVEVEVKKDLEKAIEIGNKENKKLEQSLKESKGLLHQISQEYDLYNQENMDELFDDANSDESEFEVSKDIAIRKECEDQNKDDKGNEIKASTSLPDLKSIETKMKSMKNEAYQRHIKGITEDIHLYLEKMLVLFTVCYEQLDCIEGKDQSYACLEESIFKPIWRYLLALFRLANEPKELALAYIMTERRSCSPVDCNVKPKLQMTDCDKPYDIVVTHLKTLPYQHTLLSKLECLVKCSRLVCHCIEDYYSSQNIPAIGADDLLPILCYVIIKTGQPQILSECHIIEEFIHEGYIMGEEGYCLTSIQTAVGYLVSQGMAM